jgi:hypothetical protein
MYIFLGIEGFPTCNVQGRALEHTTRIIHRKLGDPADPISTPITGIIYFDSIFYNGVNYFDIFAFFPTSLLKLHYPIIHFNDFFFWSVSCSIKTVCNL